MSGQGKIIQSTVLDKTLAIDPRTQHLYPFVAPNWLDIRAGWFLSLCTSTDDNGTVNTDETVTTTGLEADRAFLGFKSNNNNFPNTSNFFGFSNRPNPNNATNSVLHFAADLRWNSPAESVGMCDGTTYTPIDYPNRPRILSPPGSNGQFAWILRMTRANPTTNTCALYIGIWNTAGGPWIDSNYALDSRNSSATMRNLFRTIPISGTWQLVNPTMVFSSVPDALFFYWPFFNSRLTLHSLTVEKMA